MLIESELLESKVLRICLATGSLDAGTDVRYLYMLVYRLLPTSITTILLDLIMPVSSQTGPSMLAEST